ncbi:hypothetical protein [Marinobacter bohaiensis]|uniref:hypothetical protein n=1 Tax=Marinobacter bohaiensis TaxID=2201898 RepID=UPI000DAE173A|nr:hypothetical protein [Marinobacter bohaiensis]
MTAAVLNITNGDRALETLQDAGVTGEWLPWRDILHEGPVPAGLSLTELSACRARFIAERHWSTPEQVQADFAERDALLAGCGRFDAVRLWFEHDLYDQLQLLQVLDALAERLPANTALTLLCADEYLGEGRDGMRPRFEALEAPVSRAQIQLAQRAWRAFREPDPEAWVHLLDEDTTALPYLDGTVRRVLEEYPQPGTGLSRTAYHALSLIAQGENRFSPLFAEYQKTEDRRFLGDLGFHWLLDTLAQGDAALLATGGPQPPVIDPRQTYELTDHGRAVMAGRASAYPLLVDGRWIGGVELRPERFWEWDPAAGLLIPRSVTTATG